MIGSAVRTAVPGPVSAGDAISASEESRLRDVVRSVVSPGGTLDIVGGMVYIYNNEADQMPRGAVARATGVKADDLTYVAEKYTYPVYAVVVVADILEPAGIGGGYLPASHKQYAIKVADLSALSVGDRIGPVDGAYTCDADWMGDFVVYSKCDLEWPTLGSTDIATCMYLPLDAPPLLITTSTCSGGTIQAKQVDDSCAATGDARTFYVCDCANPSTTSTSTVPP